MLDIAVANTDRLVRLINDILDLERIESGRVDARRASLRTARELLDETVEVVGAGRRRARRRARASRPATRPCSATPTGSCRRSPTSPATP